MRCGEWNSMNEFEALPHQELPVQKVTMHPLFNGIDNNMAVLMMKSEFKLDKHIDTISLPDPFSPLFTNKNCMVTGFGRDDVFDKTKYQNLMKEIIVDLVHHEKCQSLLRIKLGPNFALPQSSICAGGEKGVDTCKGDGGGPLICGDVKGKTHYQVYAYKPYILTKPH